MVECNTHARGLAWESVLAICAAERSVRSLNLGYETRYLYTINHSVFATSSKAMISIFIFKL